MERSKAARYLSEELPGIIDLIQRSDVRELEVREGPIQVRVHRTSPVETAEVTAVTTADQEEVPSPPLPTEITASLVGTFYRAAQPGAPPFVTEGSLVEERTIVGIIEALQVLTEVEAGVNGTITGVLATDGQPVEYGQVLFEVMPGG